MILFYPLPGREAIRDLVEHVRFVRELGPGYRTLSGTGKRYGKEDQ